MSHREVDRHSNYEENQQSGSNVTGNNYENNWIPELGFLLQGAESCPGFCSTAEARQDGHCSNVFQVLSSFELPSTLSAQKISDGAVEISVPEQINLQGMLKGQASGTSREHANDSVEIQQRESDDDTSKEDSKSNGENRPQKRRRSAELHNLTERLRRQRIKEKMKTLQELIPNCNRRSRTSTLDDAIKYIRTLQYQVQMMSMGAGFTMWHSPWLLPPQPGQQQGVHIPGLSPFLQTGPRAGVGIGYGLEMVGPSNSINIPTSRLGLLYNPCSSASTTSGLIALHGISEVQNPDKDLVHLPFTMSSDMSCAPFCATTDLSFGSQCTDTRGE